MPFSLADCILNSNDPERRRRPHREPPRVPTPPPAAADPGPVGTGNKAAPAIPPRPAPAPVTPGATPGATPGVTPGVLSGIPPGAPPGAPSEAELAELRLLLGELSEEWKGIVEAIQELKKTFE